MSAETREEIIDIIRELRNRFAAQDWEIEYALMEGGLLPPDYMSLLRSV
jgi:hypothetical protein